MTKQEITVEHILYGIILIIGAGLRLVNLGAQSLTDYEASLALQAMRLAGGEQLIVGPQPGYTLFSAVVFYLFSRGSSAMMGNLLARIIPGIIGISLIPVPFLFRNYMGRITTLLLAFIIALEPGLIAVSKIAHGQIIAITFLIYGEIFIYKGLKEGNQKLGFFGGLFAGLSLLGGPSAWMGWMIILLAFLWMKVSSLSSRKSGERLFQITSITKNRKFWKTAGFSFLITIVSTGTLMFLIPWGMESVFSSFIVFVQGWSARLSGNLPANGIISPAVLFFSLFLYQPLAVFFGMWGLSKAVIDNIKNKDSINGNDGFLVRWVVISSVILAIYPARQIIDLVWVLIPIWILVAKQIVNLFSKNLLPIITSSIWEQGLLPFAAQCTATVLLLSYSFLNFVNLINFNIVAAANQQLRWFGVIGSLAIILLITILVGWGWSVRVAFSGLISGVTIILFLYSISTSWKTAGLGIISGRELWGVGPPIKGADLLVQTIGDFSEWNARGRENIDPLIYNVNSPALRWNLRQFPKVRYVESLSPNGKPSMIITSREESPEIASSYTGQEFYWEEIVDWNGMNITGWIKWAIYREVQIHNSSVILWVRSDLFPGFEDS